MWLTEKETHVLHLLLQKQARFLLPLSTVQKQQHQALGLTWATKKMAARLLLQSSKLLWTFQASRIEQSILQTSGNLSFHLVKEKCSRSQLVVTKCYHHHPVQHPIPQTFHSHHCHSNHPAWHQHQPHQGTLRHLRQQHPMVGKHQKIGEI